MQEVLVAQKDNAFLSQKLATIYTELELDALPEVSFVPGLSNLEYVSILKQYEFKSLLPREAPTVVPVQNLDITDIITYDQLQSIRTDINTNSLPIIISVDEYGKIVFSLE
jgi:5'-3' exonuclease